MSRKKTLAGFQFYGRTTGNLYEYETYAQEDSIAFKGAHFVLRIVAGIDERGRPKKGCPPSKKGEVIGFVSLPVKNAKKLRDQLQQFIIDAESDKLKEPAGKISDAAYRKRFQPKTK